jgi:aminomethyltransferase
MLKKSPFFDFLNRREGEDFQTFLEQSTEDSDYIEWNGFLLPSDYGDSQAEYRAIRKSCALFDVSPLRKYRITGPGSGEFLDRLLTRPVSAARPMRGIYVVFCNEDGSLKDDAILHKYNDDDYLLLPSDMDHSGYFQMLLERFRIQDVDIVDCTHAWVGFALQGPLSATVMDAMGFEGIEHLEPFKIRDFSVAGGMVRAARMGFTGDLGYECWFKPELRPAIEHGFLEAGEKLDLDIPGYAWPPSMFADWKADLSLWDGTAPLKRTRSPALSGPRSNWVWLGWWTWKRRISSVRKHYWNSRAAAASTLWRASTWTTCANHQKARCCIL